MHVLATDLVTLLDWHRQRGTAGIAAMGVLDRFEGIAVHDRWASYWHFACGHAVCHAHLQRDLQAIIETTGDAWAQALKALFLAMHQATERWRETGTIPPEEPAIWEAAFWRVLAQGQAACPAQPGAKQTDWKLRCS